MAHLRVFDKTSDTNLCSEGLVGGITGFMSNFFYQIFVHKPNVRRFGPLALVSLKKRPHRIAAMTLRV